MTYLAAPDRYEHMPRFPHVCVGAGSARMMMIVAFRHVTYTES